MTWEDLLLAFMRSFLPPTLLDGLAADVVANRRAIQPPPSCRDDKPADSFVPPTSGHDEDPGETTNAPISTQTKRFLEEQGDYLPLDKYESVPGQRVVGTGGFGDVRICQEVDNHAVRVVMKSMRYSEDDDQNHRMDRALEKEIKHLKLCRHPNVLAYLGLLCNKDNGVSIVCEYAANRSLPTYLKSVTGNHADRYKIVREVAAGLAYLHCPSPSIIVDGKSIRIVHGDIHPGNVLIMGDGRAVLGDFGLSKTASEGFVVSLTARVGGADGVTEYLAPEVHRRAAIPRGLRADWDSFTNQEPNYAGRRTDKADVFAFGMLVFTTFRGRGATVPALGTGAAATAALIKGKRPRRKDADSGSEQECLPLDDNTWELVCECWQNRPSQRPIMEDVCSRL